MQTTAFATLAELSVPAAWMTHARTDSDAGEEAISTAAALP